MSNRIRHDLWTFTLGAKVPSVEHKPSNEEEVRQHALLLVAWEIVQQLSLSVVMDDKPPAPEFLDETVVSVRHLADQTRKLLRPHKRAADLPIGDSDISLRTLLDRHYDALRDFVDRWDTTTTKGRAQPRDRAAVRSSIAELRNSMRNTQLVLGQYSGAAAVTRLAAEKLGITEPGDRSPTRLQTALNTFTGPLLGAEVTKVYGLTPGWKVELSTVPCEIRDALLDAAGAMEVDMAAVLRRSSHLDPAILLSDLHELTESAQQELGAAGPSAAALEWDGGADLFTLTRRLVLDVREFKREWYPQLTAWQELPADHPEAASWSREADFQKAAQGLMEKLSGHHDAFIAYDVSCEASRLAGRLEAAAAEAAKPRFAPAQSRGPYGPTSQPRSSATSERRAERLGVAGLVH